ncbi:glycosyltransferase family 4 protein [Aquibium microcysteis]|uniref:glycosyltransferase family 4 protein n=1 Tax=Aquibium microcysteis TaxID=675281 RepID=UPI001EF2DEE1|nr:glycosyltransferase family 4 protein [Aquibium microcysteis]
MRVLQVLPALNDGGVERSAVEMARSLGAEGLQNWVVSGGGRLVDAITSAGAVHVTMQVGAKSPLSVWRNARRLSAIVDETGIDIIHARSRVPAWVGYLAARKARHRPVFLTTFHGVYGHGSALKRWYNSVMLRGDVVIANSRFIADHLRTVYGVEDSRIVVAPRGVDTDLFDPATVPDVDVARLRKRFDAAHRPLLVYVSRLSGWKGHAVLVEALETLLDLPWTMVFAGGHDSETLRKDLAARIASGPARDRIVLAGSRNDVPALLKAADLAFSVATSPEAFGRAAVEAGAMETPVIATAHGGSLETVRHGETGWLVPPGDPQALAAAVRAALADPDGARAVGRAARAHVLDRFTAEMTLAAERSAYARVLAAREARP